MPIGVALVHRVVEGIGVAVGADCRVGYVPPVGLDEAGEDRIVIAGVEIGQAGVGIVPFPDKGFGFFGALRIGNGLGLRAKGLVGR